jgi:hypothetical protein
MTFLGPFLALAATAAVASASGGTTITRIPVTGTTVECDNGTLAVTAGSFQSTFHETATPSGAYHLVIHANAQGVQAVGPNGAKYEIPGGFWIEINATPGANVSSETSVLNVVGQGGAPNFSARGVMHVTVDAKGNVTASVDHFTTTGNCTP